ncbi:hypothetical protein [Pseudomonas putida]|uniref:hypothetical protein n=1 Tax=Pseudomonas putida TaxID=303 RepID=UPI00035F34C0|nr:hypothetical protein [Pseudomonas putida]
MTTDKVIGTTDTADLEQAPKSTADAILANVKTSMLIIEDEYRISPEEINALQRLRNLGSACAVSGIKNSEAFDPQRKEAFEAGAAAATTEMNRSTNPLLPMDEAGDDELATAQAMGWNSVWAGEENRRRSAERQAQS